MSNGFINDDFSKYKVEDAGLYATKKATIIEYTGMTAQMIDDAVIAFDAAKV